MVLRIVERYRYGCLKFIFIVKAVTFTLYIHICIGKGMAVGRVVDVIYITELMDLLGCFALCALACRFCAVNVG